MNDNDDLQQIPDEGENQQPVNNTPVPSNSGGNTPTKPSGLGGISDAIKQLSNQLKGPVNTTGTGTVAGTTGGMLNSTPKATGNAVAGQMNPVYIIAGVVIIALIFMAQGNE